MKVIFLLNIFFSFLISSVDINNANSSKLRDLNGVGPVKAESIIRYRDINGCFKSIDELSNVKGIGSKTIAKNRDEIVLGKCKN